MQKIVYFFAIAAVVLGMASCGDGNEPHLKNFKVELDKVTQTSVSFSVTPIKEGIDSYWVWVAPRTEFDLYGINHFLDDSQRGYSSTGTFNYAGGGLYPDSKYVIIIAAVKPSNEDPEIYVLDGEAEYCFFETPAWTDIDEEGETYTKDGYIHQWKKGDVEGFSIYWVMNGETKLSILIVNHGYLGHFTKKNLNAFDGAYCSYYDFNGTNCPIYDIDITGTLDKETGKIIYEGWFLMSNSKFEKGVRSRIKLTCEEEVDEE